jgi:hypothetical protein
LSKIYRIRKTMETSLYCLRRVMPRWKGIYWLGKNVLLSFGEMI